MSESPHTGRAPWSAYLRTGRTNTNTDTHTHAHPVGRLRICCTNTNTDTHTKDHPVGCLKTCCTNTKTDTHTHTHAHPPTQATTPTPTPTRIHTPTHHGTFFVEMFQVLLAEVRQRLFILRAMFCYDSYSTIHNLDLHPNRGRARPFIHSSSSSSRHT